MKVLVILAAFMLLVPSASQAVVLTNGFVDPGLGTPLAPSASSVALVVDQDWSSTPSIPPAFFWDTQIVDGPFTFNAVSSVDLFVTDDFESGDRFEVFDNNVSLGLTSAPVLGFSNDDPNAAFADANFSSGMWTLGAGAHSISIRVVDNPFDSGRGYIKAMTTPVPEPTTMALLGLGLAGAAVRRRRRKN